MRPVARFLCSLLIATTGLLPACVNRSDKTEKNLEARPEAVAEPAASNAAEAQVKPAPEPAPPAAVPPADIALETPPTAPSVRPASPEEQTKMTLEPKPVQAAALPQPKSEPAAPAPAEKKSGRAEQKEAATPAATPEKPEPAAKKEPSAAKEKSAKPEKPAAPETAPAASKEPASRPADTSAKSGEPRTKSASVAVVGDSLAVGIGMTMSNRLDKKQGIGCHPLGKVSTGLINKKFFDWEKKLSELVAKEKLSAVVVMMGGNDANNGIGGKLAGSPQWGEAYREKAESFLRIASGAGVKVVWVGLPAMRDAAYNTRVTAVNAAAKSACATVGGCLYMEPSTLFTDASGNYVQAKDIGGKHVSLRAKDGVHMTMTGYDLLCGQVLDKLSATGALPAAN